MTGALAVGVLGPVDARRDGSPLALGTPRQRRVLTALALRRGTPVPPDVLVDLVWGERAPASADNTLQGYVSGLRKALEVDRAPRSQGDVLVLEPGGYALHAALDVTELESGLDAVQHDLDVARDETGLLPDLDRDQAATVAGRLDRLLALWRGTPFAELDASPEAAAERDRLGDLRLLGLEHRAALELRLGRPSRVAADLAALTAAHPLRERLWALRALALARAGRQAEALGVLATVRTVLADELGIDPGRELTDLQVAVLRQDVGVRSPTTRPAQSARVDERPLVGRDHERGLLVDLHDEMARQPGPPAVAVLTGEPGMGKSRLARELVAHAGAAGTRVAVARCSQDEGAPALWPWSQVLAAAGASGTDEPRPRPEADPGARFRAWSREIDALLDVAQERPLLVVLDDLQWADPSTLRVLSMLVMAERPARLGVVATWRSEPAPAAPLTELAATLARHHALQLHLDGLDADGAARIVRDVTGAELDAGRAAELRERTGGNPFFLVELARLGGEDHDVAGAAATRGIHAVLTQRLSALPGDVTRTLRTAAVLGREFDVGTLADAEDVGADVVVDRLESAHAAGIVHEVDVDRFRFAHDLLRETARAEVTRTRSARIHAGAAESLARRSVPGTEAELARHWLAAGPSYAGRAWRAAGAAAAAARRMHAHDERATLLRAALAALDEDRQALEEDRCDLLLDLAEALRLAGQWRALRSVVHDALAIAGRLADTERAFAAATLPTQGAFWLASPYGEVDEIVVAGLRELLDVLPAQDDPRRCRVMLSLASEIYYATGHAEREALVDEAVAMARRLGDEPLLLTSCLAGSTSVWRSARTADQHALADEAVALARRLGDRSALADALTSRAAAANDLGLVPAMFADVDAARAEVTEQRLLFGQVLLDGLEIGWRALRGEDERVQLLAADMARAAEPMDLAQLRDSFTAVVLMQLLWSGRYDELVQVMRAGEEEALVPIASFVAAVLCRLGRAQEARAYLATRGLRTDGDDWLSPAIWSLSAEIALALDDRPLAGRVYALLAPLAGRPATAGSGIVVGPVDAFLAMAALAVGERDAARQHADDAERIAAQWQAPPVLAWLREQRAAWGI